MHRIAPIADDPQFPQLPVVTNKSAMQDIFQRQLPGFAEGRLEIERLKLKRFTYTPGKECRICYSLRVKDVDTGGEGEQIFFAMVEPNGFTAAKYTQAQRETCVRANFGPAVHWLPQLNMVLWGFPNDPRLKQLRSLVDRGALAELLQKYWHCFGLPPAVRLCGVATTLVKYVPELRCTLRHQLRLDQAGDLVIYSKTFGHRANSELIFKIMQALWKAPVFQSGEVMIPEPLFFADEMNTIFVRGLEGANADENLANLDLDRTAAVIGAALAGIHQCRIDDLRHRPEHYMMSQLAAAEQTLVNFDGAYKPGVEVIIHALREKHAGLTHVAPAPIHTAFRLSQWLLVEGKLALIDFDTFLLGNPISDVASFTAHLLYLSIKGEITQERSRSAIRHFCRAYAAHAPWGLPADVLAWQTAAHLVAEQAKKCIRLAKKNCRQTVEQLLRLAADVIDRKTSVM
jgi:aminoglycoside phosphotransferase (APT) family kinase protein